MVGDFDTQVGVLLTYRYSICSTSGSTEVQHISIWRGLSVLSEPSFDEGSPVPEQKGRFGRVDDHVIVCKRVQHGPEKLRILSRD